MIKYICQNKAKWDELELFRYLNDFDLSFDKKILDYLNDSTMTEYAFLRTLTETERSIYENIELESYNDDNELLDAVYLFAEKIMRKKTTNLLTDSLSNIKDRDIFETLETLSESSKTILENSVLEDEDFFKEWQVELDKKMKNEVTILESQIITDVPFLSSEMTIIAARPSMGKTALALSLLLEQSENYKVLFISSEMPVKRIIDRLVSYDTRISTRRITMGKLTGFEYDRVVESKERLEQNESIELAYCESMRKAKRVISNSDADLVIVDYLQLLKPSIKAERRLQIAEMSRDFKRIAVAKDIPVVLLAQINRATMNTESKRPNLSNLAESAAIEQDADNVVFIHRPSYYLEEEEKQMLLESDLAISELIVAKQRDGERGVKFCRFDKGRFYPAEEEDNSYKDDEEDAPF